MATRSRRLRRLAVLLPLLAVVSACGGGGGGEPSASGGNGRSSTGGDSESLPTAGGGEDLTLPTVPGGASDTVHISTTTTIPSTTTTTTIPTTTTTIPPPVIPSDVLFDTGQATLKPEATPYLQDLADQINERHPGARLHFVGHTDSRGSDEANNTLSLRRAEAVLNWFADHGFDRRRLTAEGAGESRLLTPDTDGSGNFNEDAGRQNRRVEIEIQL